jgi:WD40 repeat protein
VPFVGQLLIFDVRTYEQIGRPIKAPYVEGVAYKPDGRTLAFCGGRYVRLIDARTREQLAETNIPDSGRCLGRLTFTNDGSLLVALILDLKTGEHSIGFRDATTLEPVGHPVEPQGFGGAFVGSQWRAPHFALTPDGRSLVTASDTGELTWWDLKSRRKTRTLEIAAGYHALALSADGLTAAVGIDRGIQLVDVRTGAAPTAAGGPTGTSNYLLFSRDGKTVVSTNLDGTVTLWDVGSATPRETFRAHSAAVQQPVFGPDGRTLYTVSHDGTAIAWDIGGGRGLGRPFTFTHDRAFDKDWDRHPARFSRDGRLIAVGLKEEGIGLWDARKLRPVAAPLLDTGGEVKALAFSADGRTLAAVTLDGMATVWDVESRSLRQAAFRVDRWLAVGVSFSADGTMLATAGGEGVKLWEVATGEALGRVGDGSAAGDVAFSPTEPFVAFVREGWDYTSDVRGGSAVEGGGVVEIWDVGRRSRIRTLEVGADVLGGAVAFSPDGRTLATGGIDPLVHLWDVRTGKLIRELEQGAAGANSLEFSPDSRILGVSGLEPVASLWDVATGTRIGPSLTAGSRKAMMDLSPDGRRLLMTNGDGKGAVWDVDAESWARRACSLANRTLTRKEWEEFLPGRPYEPACR